ncbi:ClpX C4-type zinc finger protein [Prauserella muralis]|uniref:Uncharacterized protein n=1 Tax=Prauserella muralis TaxID=588067 RepID=A0A2V4AMA0_9PSEU|nr:hypothetical protein BAY60_27230 [Prauserella muralis]TWE30252.1 ClpX C4-type zinc finger protein [Prauserella muralis]
MIFGNRRQLERDIVDALESMKDVTEKLFEHVQNRVGEIEDRVKTAEGAAADPDTLHCAFCGKSRTKVRQLIAGPGVHICNECVLLCVEILFEETPAEVRPFTSEQTPDQQETPDGVG